MLPKPFTKEGLLNMLEKHLVHLKKMNEGLEMAPPSATSLHHSAGHSSIKEDVSPSQSPSTMSTWNSPGTFAGMSPANSGPYTGNHVPATFGVDPSQQYASPRGALRAVQHQAGHRRHVSDMSGGPEEMNQAKRHQQYHQSNQQLSHMGR